MRMKRYTTSVTARVDCTGARHIVEYAIRNALAFPIDYIEVQVQTGDRGSLYIGREALNGRDQLKAMDCEAFFRVVAGHPPVGINIDLTGQCAQAAQAEDFAALESLVREAGLIGRVQLTGITPSAIASVHHGAPELPFWLNLVPGFGEATFPPFSAALAGRIRRSGAIGLHTNYRFVTRLLQQCLAENELLLSVQGADRERDLRRLLILPVDNITTTRVSTLLELRSRISQLNPTLRPQF